MSSAKGKEAVRKASLVGGKAGEDDREKTGGSVSSPPVSEKASPKNIQNSRLSKPKKRRGGSSKKADGVAIIGLSCRLPGAKNAQAFWDNLVQGIQSIQKLPRDRWDPEQANQIDSGKRQGTDPLWLGVLDQIDRFDNRFFNISPREARHMDPQQRLLLEETWRCIEDSGVPLSLLQDKKTSVHVGPNIADYHQGTLQEGSAIDSYTATGNYPSIAANRLSSFLGLNGPSMAVDAACASSLVTLHLARETLLSGECDYAIAASTSLSLLPWRYRSFSLSRMLSPDGQCKTFDARADGFVPGEGIITLLLRPLGKARAAGDHIYGVIRSLAVNHGGRAPSLTAPRVAAQREVILQAYEKADFDPSAVTYVETHGTGTSLGDPIEVEALTRAFRKHTDHRQFCQIGSVKPNIGHLETASGLAGLVKVLLMMRHRMIPPSLNLSELNPIIGSHDSPFKYATKLTPWKARGRGNPLRAGVSSYGFGGANAHCLLESSPAYPIRRKKRSGETGDAFFLLSARDGSDMERMLALWRTFITGDEFGSFQLSDLCATLLTGRSSFPIRFGGIVTGKEDLRTLLKTPPPSFSKTKADAWILRLEPFELGSWESTTRLRTQYPVFKKHLESLLGDAVRLGLIPRQQASFSPLSGLRRESPFSHS